MITPSYGLTATERVLPRLALDWTTGLAQPGVDVVRAGVATFVGSNGLIQSASANTQRIDYSTGTSGLLVEESRTNILLQSNNFGTTWSGVRASATLVTVTTPDGAASGYKIIEDTQTGGHFLRQIGTYTSAVYTFSVYLQKDGRDWVRLQLGSTTLGTAVFNLATGVISSTITPGFTAKIKDEGDGWYRCSITGTASSIANNMVAISLQTTETTSSYTGDNTSGVYVYGAQLEAGAFPTSYIPTEAAAVTRNADVATMTGTNFSDWFNASEGAFEIQSQLYSASGTKGYLSANDGTFNNVIQIYSTGTSGNYEVVTGGVTQATQGQSSTINTNLLSRCVAYKLNNCGQAINGSFYGVDTSCTIPTVDRLQIGGINAGTSARFKGLITKISFWPQRLSSAEIAAFSKG
jgi:hypothetical protein